MINEAGEVQKKMAAAKPTSISPSRRTDETHEAPTTG
jgi:hypothetical protein